jgi:outer membrane protein assembly factor BamE (lipoprotein component of BamABCDE complex)
MEGSMEKIFALIAMIIFLSGCATATNVVGRPIPQENVSRIKKGVTTQENILAWFGEPYTVTINEKGETIFSYTYIIATATCNPGGCKSEGTQQMLMITINPNGKVISFSNTAGKGPNSTLTSGPQ